MKSQQNDRRRFLKNGAALAGLAVARTLPVHAKSATEDSEASRVPWEQYGKRSDFVKSARVGGIGSFVSGSRTQYTRNLGLRTPLQDSSGIITPASLHYMISHGNMPPDIDPDQHRLMIHGMVERPLIFTLEELKRLPSATRIHFLECAGNSAALEGAVRNLRTATVQDTHGLTSCSIWAGVPLSILLKNVGVKKGTTWIVAEGSETSMHSKSIPIEKAMDDCLVVYSQNGEPLRPEQGYPLRLLVPGWEGINNVKWLRRIKLVDEPYMQMRESTKYPQLRLDGKSRWFNVELGPKSVITSPSGGQKLLEPGFYEISGLAWSGAGAIRRVEISTDGGANWRDAELQNLVYRKAHARFVFDWNWDGKPAMLQSRCTDDKGQVQPTLSELAKMWDVSLNYFQSTSNMGGHNNAIQTWKITSDGSIENAFL